MRDIKFRAWDLDAKDKMYSWDEIKNNLFEHIKHNRIEVMQYTGLKAKHGVEIYEGDIYRHNDQNFVCVYSDMFGWCFVCINANLGNVLDDRIIMTNHNYRSQSDIQNFTKYIEVIGNIYQNPELLK